MKTLTIKELKAILDTYDESTQVVITINGNCYPIIEERISSVFGIVGFEDSYVENTISGEVLCFEMY